MNLSQRMRIMIPTVLICVGLDQLSKVVAQRVLPHDAPIRLLGDTIRLQYTENVGAFLSFGARLPEAWRFWLLTVAASGLLVAVVLYLLLARHVDPRMAFALSLVLGGGISNLLDRALRDGAVGDFMNIGIGWLRTGVFNLADVAIMAGLGLMILFEWQAQPADSDHQTTDTPAS